MIALDSSALVAVAIEEDGFETFERAISANRCLVGAPTLQETYMVLTGKHATDPGAFIERALSVSSISVVAFARTHYEISRFAFDRYGKGRSNSAGLNFGDCMSYAVAKFHDVPLLYKGGDFTRTDIRSALAP